MTEYKRVRNTLWAFGPHYKACMRPIIEHELVEVNGKLALLEHHLWEVKVFGYLGKREVEAYPTARDAFKRLRFFIYDYEVDYKLWGRMLP